MFRTPFRSFFRGVNFGTTIKKNGPLLGPSRGQICHVPIFFYEKIFFRPALFLPSRTAKKAAKRTQAGFRSCGSALATLLPLSTPDRAAGSEVPGSAGALVRFGAHSPPTRRRSSFMPRGTARTHLTTNAAILPTPQPLPSMLPKRTCLGGTVPISFSVVSGEPSD